MCTARTLKSLNKIDMFFQWGNDYLCTLYIHNYRCANAIDISILLYWLVHIFSELLQRTLRLLWLFLKFGSQYLKTVFADRLTR